MVIEQLTARGLMSADALYEAPFSNLYATGPEELFADKGNLEEQRPKLNLRFDEAIAQATGDTRVDPDCFCGRRGRRVDLLRSEAPRLSFQTNLQHGTN